MHSEEKLGLVQTFIVVWVSGLVVNFFFDAFVLRGVAISITTGGFLSGHGRPYTAAVILLLGRALLCGLAVTYGVRLMGFYVSFSLVAFALALGSFLGIGLTLLTMRSAAGDTTGILEPALGMVFLPAGLLLGTVLPMVLINGGTRRLARAIPPGRSYEGMPPTRPY